MPLPDQAFDCQGGCNCGAVRYSLAIPPVAERPLHPLASPTEPVPLPFLVFDHCNDCRRATASILPSWICAPIEMASASLVLKSKASLAAHAINREGQPLEERGEWKAAQDIFAPESLETGFLKHYESSHQRWRWFCEGCGTNVAYTATMPEGFPNMLDIALGSVDRKFLEGDFLTPERHLWWDYGIDWIKGLATKGKGMLPIHPDYKIMEQVRL